MTRPRRCGRADIHFQPKYVFAAIEAGGAGGPGLLAEHGSATPEAVLVSTGE